MQHPVQRINQAILFIDEQLGGDVSLTKVAEVACYSPFHFHRLFKHLTGETLQNYVLRKRVEKAARLLIHRPDLSITNVGEEAGFQSGPVFSRSFRQAYGMSPAAFRKENLHSFRKIGKVDSKMDQDPEERDLYLRRMEHLLSWIRENARIEIVEKPETGLAYLSHRGVAGVEQTFEKLLRWAGPKGIMAQKGATVCRLFHDSFKTTDADKVRMSIGIAGLPDPKESSEISWTRIPAGKYLVGHFEIVMPDFEKAWTGMFLSMQDMGYKKAEAVPYELYHNDFRQHPEGKCRVEMCIAVEG
jgi:AraC family transcriptional regulator